MDDRFGDDRAQADAVARNRFMLINLMRVFGVIMILAGIAVFNEVLPLPEWAGLVLIVLGMGETFVVPTMLARLWSTQAQDRRNNR